MNYQTDLFGKNEQDLEKEWEKAGKLICKYPDCNGKCILKLTPQHKNHHGMIICSVCNEYQKWERKPKNKRRGIQRPTRPKRPFRRKSNNISTEELGWI